MEDRNKNEDDNDSDSGLSVSSSKDPDAKWLKKERKVSMVTKPLL
jgi:hypothetical protein